MATKPTRTGYRLMPIDELDGNSLEWAVASILYPKDTVITDPSFFLTAEHDFTSSYANVDIMAARGISSDFDRARTPAYRWRCYSWIPKASRHLHGLQVVTATYGPTMLVAGMRCVVSMEKGPMVEIPEIILGVSLG